MQRIDSYNIKAIPMTHKYALVMKFNDAYFLLVSAVTKDSSYITNVARRTQVIGGEMQVISVDKLKEELGVITKEENKRKKRKKKKLKKTNFGL